MKKIILSLILLLAPITFLAQTTHDINWTFNPSGDLTINQGDSVRWTWGDNSTHTVTSTSGVETFDSGNINGMGMTFTHTFNNIGVTDYRCDIHPGNMTGRITVQVLNIENESKQKTQLYPNPVSNILTVKTENTISNIRITNVIGKVIIDKNYNLSEIQLNVSSLKSGMYFIQISNDKNKKALKFFKK
ncbi:T9SS type A sorting domain-containing protein [Pseudofulvibacter geojedonensis]|uniref:T9SS type A sorting domain-containing protein n=1 Tax=Pseudofulvibacter geojedonensis TaxID=1123758 RepID=A0ABW3HY21_9FLAO